MRGYLLTGFDRKSAPPLTQRRKQNAREKSAPVLIDYLGCCYLLYSAANFLDSARKKSYAPLPSKPALFAVAIH